MTLLTRVYVLLILVIGAAVFAAEAGAPRHSTPVVSAPAQPAACVVPDDPPACAAAPERPVPLRWPAF